MRGTKKIVVREVDDRISISNFDSLICLNDHFKSNTEPSIDGGTQNKIVISNKNPIG